MFTAKKDVRDFVVVHWAFRYFDIVVLLNAQNRR